MTNLTYYGHACFSVEVAGKKILFDPFITPNPMAKEIDLSSIEADYVLISHGHEDHVADAGFLPHEQQWLNQLYKQIGYCDAFRLVNNDSDEFSWWPSGTQGEGDGWRTDLQIVSEALKTKVEYAIIYKSQSFSSHQPVIVDYDIGCEEL